MMRPTEAREPMKWGNEDQFRTLVYSWANKIRVEPKHVYIRPMIRKWASCSRNGLLTFSTELLKEKPEFGGYVIVHELVHLKVPNHGKLFKSLPTAILPDWKQRAKDTDAEEPTNIKRYAASRKKCFNKSDLTIEQIEAKRIYARRRARMIREGTWYLRKRPGPIPS
jgi:hypothetical protein